MYFAERNLSCLFKPIPEFFLPQFLVEISKRDVGIIDLVSSFNVPKIFI